MTQELPNLVRVDLQGTGLQSLGFDGDRCWKSGGNPDSDDTNLLESLAYDSSARFFAVAAGAGRMRHLGDRFRMDGLTKGPYHGPVYDIYMGLETVRQAGPVKTQPKYYHVNSNTLLMERVSYRDSGPGNHPPVVTVVDDWLTVSGNRVPRTTRRLENGVEVVRMVVTNATVGPALADGVFGAPKH